MTRLAILCLALAACTPQQSRDIPGGTITCNVERPARITKGVSQAGCVRGGTFECKAPTCALYRPGTDWRRTLIAGEAIALDAGNWIVIHHAPGGAP